MRTELKGLLSVFLLMVLSAAVGCSHLMTKPEGDRNEISIEKYASTHVYFPEAKVTEGDGTLRIAGRVKRKGNFHVTSGYVCVKAFDALNNIIAQKAVTHVPKALCLRHGRHSSGFTADLPVKPDQVARVEVRYVEAESSTDPSAVLLNQAKEQQP